MSRGHGTHQRRVVALLSASEEVIEKGLPLRALRPALGRDRSNARRVLLSLIRRGDVEEVACAETGERHLRLTFPASLPILWRLRHPGDEDPLEEEEREWRREVETVLAALREKHREEHREGRRVHCEREAMWEEPGRPQRRRPPGPNQLRVIAVLVRYAEDPRLGLPRSAVARIARGPAGEGDRLRKANTLRAVRSLVRCGTLQQSKDGERLRLSERLMPWLWEGAPDVVEPPLDDEQAEAVLKGCDEFAGVA